VGLTTSEDFLVHPGFLWVKNLLLEGSELRFPWKFLGFLGVQLQASAMKVDGDLKMLAVAPSVSVFFIVWIFELRPSLVALVIR